MGLLNEKKQAGYKATIKKVCQQIEDGVYVIPPSEQADSSSLKALVDNYHQVVYCEISKVASGSFFDFFQILILREEPERHAWFKKHRHPFYSNGDHYMYVCRPCTPCIIIDIIIVYYNKIGHCAIYDYFGILRPMWLVLKPTPSTTNTLDMRIRGGLSNYSNPFDLRIQGGSSNYLNPLDLRIRGRRDWLRLKSSKNL